MPDLEPPKSSDQTGPVESLALALEGEVVVSKKQCAVFERAAAAAATTTTTTTTTTTATTTTAAPVAPAPAPAATRCYYCRSTTATATNASLSESCSSCPRDIEVEYMSHQTSGVQAVSVAPKHLHLNS